MILLREPKTLTWCAVLLLTGVALWGWTVDPARPGRWLFIALFVLGLCRIRAGRRASPRAGGDHGLAPHRVRVGRFGSVVAGWSRTRRSDRRVGPRLGTHRAASPVDHHWRLVGGQGELFAKAAVAVAARRRTVRLVAGASVRRLAVHGGRRCGGWGVVGGATARPGEVPVTSDPWHRGRAGGRAEADVVGLAT